MSRPKKTLRNPHQLTPKQSLTIEKIADDIQSGKGYNPVEAHELFYNTKNKNITKSLTSENMTKPNFRAGLIEALKKRNILGVNGKLQQRLAEGLDAKTEKKKPAYSTRLSYIQEINKILGVYAPTKIDQRSLKITTKLSPEELDQKINAIQEELQA